MRIHPSTSLGLTLASIACTAALPTTTSQPSDPRTALAGTWTIEFRLDSMMSRAGSPTWQAGSFATAAGRLQLIYAATGNDRVASEIEISFDSLLGRPMSCFDPRPKSTAVVRDGDIMRLVFTPDARDCGFGAAGMLRGDSLVGTWDETSFAGPVVMGRFRMVRVR